MICCEEGNYNIANQLLKSGANIDLENGYGYDALAIAIKNGVSNFNFIGLTLNRIFL